MSTPPILPLDPAIVEDLKVYFLGTPIQGPTGKTAYQLAVDNGFVGTETQWLEYIKAKNIELRTTSTDIEWRLENGTWVSLIPIEYLRGEKGDQGDNIKGDKGDTGDLATVSIGTVTTGEAGTNATVEVTGPPENKVLNFVIPRGNTGVKGDTGEKAWTPTLQLTAHGERRVFSVDWANGTGVKPTTGYLGSTGITSNIAEAMDVRGTAGAPGSGSGDMIAANNLSEVDSALARANLQVPHNGGTAEFTEVNLGTGGASAFSDNDGSFMIHAGSPALGEGYFSFDKNGDLHAHQGSFFTEDGEVWHAGNFTPANYMPVSGGNFTGNMGISRGNAYTTFHISANAGQNKRILFQTNSVNRWFIGATSSAESGGNAGSNLDITRADDSGTAIDSPISINRQTGYITANPFNQNISVYSANQTDTLKLERANSGNNFINFTSTAGINRLGCQNNDALTFQTRNGVNHTVWHTGNADLHAGIIGYSTNLNLDTQTGGFTHSGSISSTTGRPSNQWHQVLGMFRSATDGAQLALNVQGDGVSYRRQNNGTWGSWNSLMLAHNPVATGYMRVPNMQLNDAAGTYRALKFTTNGQDRWSFLMENTAESSTYGGGNLWITRHNNSGGGQENVMHFNRANGNVTVYSTLTVNGAIVTNLVNGAATGVEIQGSGGLTVSGSGGFTATNGSILMQRTTADAQVIASSNAGRSQSLVFQTAGSTRWAVTSDNTAEGGSNAGSNFYIRRYSDTGTSLGNAITITRSNGNITTGGALGVGGAVTSSGNFVMSGGGGRVFINSVRQPGITVAATAPTANRLTGDLWIW